MFGKRLVISSLIAALIAGAFGCEKKGNLESKVRTINGIEYKIDGNKLTQVTEDEDKTVKFGVIADPHGFYNSVEAFSQDFKQKNLDGIIMLGDYAQHFREKPNPRLSDYEEIVFCLESAAKTGLPVYVIPGNHEMRKDYEKAINKLSKRYNNLFDLSKIRMVDGDDFDFVSNPYGNDDGFSYFPESFLGDNPKMQREIIKYAQKLQSDDDPEILLTHQPPKCNGVNGIDVIFNGRNVGNNYITEAMRRAGIKISLSSHIHEAGKRGCTSDGKPVEPNTFSDDLRFNPGSACPWKYLNGEFYDGMAGILIIEGNKAKYQIITLN